MNAKILPFIISLISLPLFADELDLRQWDDLSIIAQQHQRDQERNNGILPPQIQPATDSNGVIQQVITYDVNQLKATVPLTTHVIDTKWGNSGKSASNTSKTSDGANAQDASSNTPPPVTFEVQPINSKAYVDFHETVRATFTYQVWSHQAEIRIAPYGSIWHGVKLEFSHISGRGDQQDRLLLTLAW